MFIFPGCQCISCHVYDVIPGYIGTSSAYHTHAQHVPHPKLIAGTLIAIMHTCILFVSM